MIINKQLLWIALSIVTAIAIILAIVLPILLINDDISHKIPENVLDEVPLIDGHNDLPHTIYRIEKNQLKSFEFDSDLKMNPKWNVMDGHTDLLRLRKGKVGGQFWVAFVYCSHNFKDAVERTMEQIDIIKRLVKKYPNDMKLVTTNDGIMEAFKEKKIASMIQVEGGHSIDSRLAVLRLFYEVGVRAMTLTHTCNLPWADASPIDNTTNPKKNLTEWGINVVREMNRLGMIVDISHVSEGVMATVLDNSKAPVIFSHSSIYTLHNHHRNVKDHILKKLKENNGVIMINFYTYFIGGNNTIQRVVEHINYVRDFIGVDHVGIGADYNGVESVPEGLEDVSKYPDLFKLLAEDGHGYTPWNREELKKLAGLNFMRVFKQVEKVRDELQNEGIVEKNIPYDSINTAEIRTCRVDVDSYKDDKDNDNFYQYQAKSVGCE